MHTQTIEVKDLKFNLFRSTSVKRSNRSAKKLMSDFCNRLVDFLLYLIKKHRHSVRNEAKSMKFDFSCNFADNMPFRDLDILENFDYSPMKDNRFLWRIV